jgi:hypothetical protein
VSRIYRCRVKRDLSTSVQAGDEVQYRIRVNDILDQEETTDILRQKLVAAGGEERGDGKIVLEVDGAEVEVDPHARTAVARVEQRRQIDKHVDREVRARSWRDRREEAQAAAQSKVESQARSELESERRAAQQQLEQEVRRRLGDAADAIAKALRTASAQTEQEAVVRKAQRMGKVKSVTESEDSDTGDRKIVIQLELPD